MGVDTASDEIASALSACVETIRQIRMERPDHYRRKENVVLGVIEKLEDIGLYFDHVPTSGTALSHAGLGEAIDYCGHNEMNKAARELRQAIRVQRELAERPPYSTGKQSGGV